MFSIRIVTTDHYQGSPIPGLDVQYTDFRASVVKKVPVIRVYGSTAQGQKTCMHVHGVFPYLYVPYDGTQPWDRYLRLFANSLDKAINVAQGNASSEIQHVYKITLVSGIPMYGYHEREQQFLKIYFYNPNIIRRAADLLLGGAVLNKGFQPHESHIPYTLQMFIDYNLYGMNMLNVAAIKFRRRNQDENANPEVCVENRRSDMSSPTSPNVSLQDWLTNASLQSQPIWNQDTITSDLYLGNEVVRQSTCELEVDVVAADIINRLEVDANVGNNPGLAALWEDERQRKRNQGQSSQITPPASQDRGSVEISESDQALSDRFREIVLSQLPYVDSQPDSMSESSQEEVPPTQSASSVDFHSSQQEDDFEASQSTIILGEEEDEGKTAIVNMDSIQRVVSMSQSFSATPLSQQSDEPQDRSLAALLASLAEDSSPPASQAAAGQVTILEEKDSILLEAPVVPDDETVERDEAETLEMSQIVWEDGSQGNEGKESKGEELNFDLEGLDTTWNDSQAVAISDEEEDLKIPQYDGANDEKPPTAKKSKKKRLGATGPVIGFDKSSAQRQAQQNTAFVPGYNNPTQNMCGPNDNQFSNGNQYPYQGQGYGMEYGNYNYNNMWNQQAPYSGNPGYGVQGWDQQMNWNMMNSPNGNTQQSHHQLSQGQGLASSQGQQQQESYALQGQLQQGAYGTASPQGRSQQGSHGLTSPQGQPQQGVPTSSHNMQTSPGIQATQSGVHSPHGIQSPHGLPSPHGLQSPHNLQHGNSQENLPSPHSLQLGNSQRTLQSPHNLQPGNSRENLQSPHNLRLGNSQGSLQSPQSFQPVNSQGSLQSPQGFHQGNSQGSLQSPHGFQLGNSQDSAQSSNGSVNSLSPNINAPLNTQNMSQGQSFQTSVMEPRDSFSALMNDETLSNNLWNFSEFGGLSDSDGTLSQGSGVNGQLSQKSTDQMFYSRSQPNFSTPGGHNLNSSQGQLSQFSPNQQGMTSTPMGVSPNSHVNMNVQGVNQSLGVQYSQPSNQVFQNSQGGDSQVNYPEFSGFSQQGGFSQQIDPHTFSSSHSTYHSQTSPMNSSAQSNPSGHLPNSASNVSHSPSSVLPNRNFSAQSDFTSVKNVSAVSTSANKLHGNLRHVAGESSDLSQTQYPLSGGSVTYSGAPNGVQQNASNSSGSSSMTFSRSHPDYPTGSFPQSLPKVQGSESSQNSYSSHSYPGSQSNGQFTNSQNSFNSSNWSESVTHYNNHPNVGYNPSVINPSQGKPPKTPKRRGPKKKSEDSSAGSTTRKKPAKKSSPKSVSTFATVTTVSSGGTSLGSVLQRSTSFQPRGPIPGGGNLLEKLLMSNENDNIKSEPGSKASSIPSENTSSKSSFHSPGETNILKPAVSCSVQQPTDVDRISPPETKNFIHPPVKGVYNSSSQSLNQTAGQPQMTSSALTHYLSPFRERTPESDKWPQRTALNPLGSLFSLQDLVTNVPQKTQFGHDVRQIATDGKPYSCSEAELQSYIQKNIGLLESPDTVGEAERTTESEIPIRKPTNVSELIRSKVETESRKKRSLSATETPPRRISTPGVGGYPPMSGMVSPGRERTISLSSTISNHSMPYAECPNRGYVECSNSGRSISNNSSQVTAPGAEMIVSDRPLVSSFRGNLPVVNSDGVSRDRALSMSSNPGGASVSNTEFSARARTMSTSSSSSNRTEFTKSLKQKSVNRPSLVRSFSTPAPQKVVEAVKRKRGRPRKIPVPPVPVQPSKYTYSFTVPPPVYKKVNYIQLKHRPPREGVKVVRMHPMDARRYSLLKIGREVVKLKKLSHKELEKVKSITESKIQSKVPKKPSQRRNTVPFVDKSKRYPSYEELRVEVAKSKGATKLVAERERTFSELWCIEDQTNGPQPIQKITLASIIDKAFSSLSSEEEYQPMTTGCEEEELNVGKDQDQPSPDVIQTQGGKEEQAKQKTGMYQDQFFKYLQQTTDMPVPVDEKYRKNRHGHSKLKVSVSKTARKKKLLKLHKKLPLVIDPDQEELPDPVLKDVSLTEASDGSNTPVQSRTPITGRSPIRHQPTGETYRLFDSDVLDPRIKSSSEDTDTSTSEREEVDCHKGPDNCRDSEKEEDTDNSTSEREEVDCEKDPDNCKDSEKEEELSGYNGNNEVETFQVKECTSPQTNVIDLTESQSSSDSQLNVQTGAEMENNTNNRKSSEQISTSQKKSEILPGLSCNSKDESQSALSQKNVGNTENSSLVDAHEANFSENGQTHTSKEILNFSIVENNETSEKCVQSPSQESTVGNNPTAQKTNEKCVQQELAVENNPTAQKTNEKWVQSPSQELAVENNPTAQKTNEKCVQSPSQESIVENNPTAQKTNEKCVQSASQELAVENNPTARKTNEKCVQYPSQELAVENNPTARKTNEKCVQSPSEESGVESGPPSNKSSDLENMLPASDNKRPPEPDNSRKTSQFEGHMTRSRSSSDSSCRKHTKAEQLKNKKLSESDKEKTRKSVRIGRRERKRKQEVPGVDYLVTGKFKGHKKMTVQLKKLNISNGTVVKLSQVFSLNSLFQKNGLSQNKTVQAPEMAAHELFCDNIFEKFKSLQDSKFFGNIVSDDSSKDSTYFQPRKSRLSLLRRSRPNDDVIEISSSEDEDGSPGLDLQPVINSDWTSNDSVIFINNEDDDDDEMDDGKESCEENSVHSRPVKTTPKYVKKKKKLSKSRKIHTAFNGASYRARKRRTRSHSGKLMTSLSVLHQATLANLMDVAPSYCDSTDDYRTKYEDALYTMSLYSPPPPEELEKSPPRPYSPTDLGDIDSSPEKTNVFNDLHQALMSDEESRSPVYSPIKTSQFVSVNESPMKKVSTLNLSDLDLSNQTNVERTENKGCIKDNKADELKRDTDEVKEEDIQVKMDRNSLKSSFQTEIQSNISEEQLESLISEKSTTGLVFNVTNKIPNSRGPKIGPLHFKRKAIVKLQPLTEREIKRYCFKTICSGKENVPIISDNESFSPPDLGPPIIPGKYSKEDSKSPPNLVRNDQFIDSEESGTPDILETCGSDQNEERTPVVNGSVNIISTVNYRTRKGTNEKNPPKSGNGDTQAENHSSINRGTQQDGCYRNQEKITRKRKPSPQGQGQKMFRSLSPSKRRVLRPKEAPPSRLRVEMTTRQYGLHTVVNQDAFCSNADDVPEKPREVGGRLLTLQSNRVTGLMEYLSTVACEGLSTIRQILATTDRILPSQTDNQTLMDSITKDHTLRCSVLGDRLVTMVPCKQSPSSASVRSWLEKKELYRQQKMKEKSGKSQKSDSLEKGKQYSDSQENGKSVEFTKIVTLTPAQQRGGDLGINITATPKQRFLTREVSFNETTEIFHVDDDSFSPVKQNGESSMCLENTQPPCQERESDSVFKSHDSDDENIISPSPPQQTISFRRKENIISPSPPKTMIRKEDIISPSPPKTKMMRKEDIISPSPPKTMIRSIRKDSQQLGKSLTSRMRLSQMSSATVAKKQSCDLVRRNLIGSSHSTPVSARDQKSLLEGINVTPISGNVDIEEKVKLNIETSGVFQTPRRVTLPRKQSIEKGDPRRSLMSSAEMREMATPTNSKGNVSQIDGPTPKNSFGFKVSQHNLQDAKALHEVQNLTVLSLELHAETRRDLMPDPEIDPIVAVFYNILNDVSAEDKKCDITGVILVDRKSKESQEALKNKSTTTQPTSPQPSMSHDTGSKVRSSDQPSTSYQRSPSPQPSTSSHPAPSQKGKRSRSRSPSPRPVCKVPKASDIEDTVLQKSGVNEDLEVTYVENEEELFQEILKLFSKWDPDILVGFEIQKFSWGYLLQRASHLSVNLCAQMSRIPDEKRKSSFKAESDEWGADHSSEIHLAGRVILNLWRILRHEVTLNIYTFENIAHHVIHKRVPHYSFQTLNSWFKHRTHLYRWRFIRYYLIRVQSNLKIIDQLDLIGRTSEFARVFGIEFYHVLSRGSQYRVESMMLRLAKPMNFIPASPSVQQRARMRAPECIPLTLEPESRFYADPVVVLDFQSLYPSIMIAYNYCFSTCVGRLDFLEIAHEGPIEFGCTHLRISPKTLNRIKNDVTVSPNGVVFVKEHVRKGIISKMVEEILNTRIMVKKSMKEHKDDKGLYRLLDARQMGLKLIANVTYGYTGANFSGRMPCIEVGDSIVRKARETLERAIRLVEDRPEWGARVVYGDTDSMFIEMKGKSKEEAFNIGHEICDAVTAMNPKPIKLKFEKVYYPCVLQTKKRYVGYSFETVDQKEPVFDAKGIETVRRDSCAAVSKILERSIKILFGCKDVSKVKEYVLRQCQKFMEGKVTMQDCIFAKEYRGMKGYKPGACVPALEIAKKLLRHDRQAEPRTGERVPYVIIYGSPGLPLIQLVRQPHEVLADPSLRLNATYYITKQILPPLDRLFSLLGVDVFSWYNDMPKVVRVVPSSLLAPDQKKGTISQYFSATNCPVCDRQTNQAICNICIKDPQNVCVTLCDRIRKWEKIYSDLVKVCNTCMGAQDENQPCVSLDCPIMFRRVLAKQDVQKGTQLRDVVNKVLDF